MQEVLDLINSILVEKEKVKYQQRSTENAKIQRDDFARSLLDHKPAPRPAQYISNQLIRVDNQELLQESVGMDNGEENIEFVIGTLHNKLMAFCCI